MIADRSAGWDRAAEDYTTPSSIHAAKSVAESRRQASTSLWELPSCLGARPEPDPKDSLSSPRRLPRVTVQRLSPS